MNKSKNLFKILIFPVIIGGLLFTPLPVLAEGDDTTPTDPSNSDDSGDSNNSDDSGSEWSGEITDSPKPQPQPTPTPQPTPQPQPQPQPQPTTPSYNTQRVVTPTSTTSETPETPEPTKEVLEPIEEITEPIEETPVQVDYIIDLSDILTSYEAEEAVEIPKTTAPHPTDLETIRKTCLSIFIFTGIISFLSLSIWAGIKLNKLAKINRTKKLYEEAKNKSREIKKIKITRRAN